MYDFFNATALETPALTLQWYNTPAETAIRNGDMTRYTTHKLMIGSHGACDSEFEPESAPLKEIEEDVKATIKDTKDITIVQDSQDVSSNTFQSRKRNEFIGLADIDLPTGPYKAPSIIPSKLDISASAVLSSIGLSATNASPANTLPNTSASKGLEGFPNNFKFVKKIYHRNSLLSDPVKYTDLSIARYNPLNNSQIAAFTTQGEVMVYDINNTSASHQRQQGYDKVLIGHAHGGSALDWNPKTNGHLVTGASDGSVAFWDLNLVTVPTISAKAATVSPSLKRILDSSLKNAYQPTMFSQSIHSAPVMDVKWNMHVPTVFATCSEDGSIALVDTRASLSDPVARITAAHVQAIDADSDGNASNAQSSNRGSRGGNGSSGSNSKGNKSGRINTPTQSAAPNHLSKESAEAALVAAARRKRLAEPSISLGSVNSISFNPFNEYVLASGGSDRTVNIWDLRLLGNNSNNTSNNLNSNTTTSSDTTPLFSLQGGHSGDVTSVKWSPTHPSILASAGYDRRIAIWDASRIGQSDNLSHDEQEDGPPELLFLHGGHTSRIADFDWHHTLPFVLASIGEDNVVQVWKPVDHATKEEEDEDEDEEEDEEDDNDREDKDEVMADVDSQGK